MAWDRRIVGRQVYTIRRGVDNDYENKIWITWISTEFYVFVHLTCDTVAIAEDSYK